MKVGVIRCQQTEDICVGQTCLEVAREGTGVYEEEGPVTIVGFASCGGCPRKEGCSPGHVMVKQGAEAIALASCMTKGLPWEYPCPHLEQIKCSIRKKTEDQVEILDWTH